MSGRSKQTVLIVDDQEINRGILKYILENDYNTMEAENGLQALDILKGSRDRVNAILLDVIMEYSEFRRLIERYYRDMRKTCYLIDEASIPFTISFGMASSEEFSSGFSWEELLKLADKRMYEKKSRKREA